MDSDQAPGEAITHEEAGTRGAFRYTRGGQRLAEMTYSRAGTSMVIIDHTEVDKCLRGRGVARQLLDALVAWARETHTRVMATCPYARAQFERDPSIRDVLA
jgi:predicted GNAT family acetyltransferase